MNGFILIDKPSGWTSRDVCNKLRHILNEEKTGHTGTLDPFATGLLIVSINKATKAGIYLEDDDKEYVAELELGKKTDTGDINGKVIEEEKVKNISLEDVQKVLTSFLGNQEQIPPMTSAIHYQGVKLYELAHQGIEVERKPRKIRINNIELLSLKDNIVTFKCNVSKGTYIRVLGEDIAKALGNIGYLKSLRRTRIGDFDVKDASIIEEAKRDNIIPLTKVLEKYLTKYIVSDDGIERVKNGANLTIREIKDDTILVVDSSDNALAIYKRKEDCYFSCLRGLW